VSTEAPDLSSLRQRLRAFQEPAFLRSIGELLLSAIPLALIWAGAWVAVSFGLWQLALLLSIPAAGFVVRLFMIQHDCGHQSFFKSPAANDWVGRLIGAITVTPYDCWRRTHAIHHATSGDLDRRGLGALATLTVEEYQARRPWDRFLYRLYRNPFVLFVLGPFYVFFLQQRLPVGLMREGFRPWLSAMGTNVAIILLVALAWWLGGWQGVLLVHLSTMWLAASIGVWLFYVQHQFDSVYWERTAQWSASEAAMHGSSHYDLPLILRWMTANIGVHHVHHANSRIPFYRLPRVLRRHPEYRDVSRLTFVQSLRAIPLALWDEKRKRLISFREERADRLGAIESRRRDDGGSQRVG
jgi:acyl-lipid omega-6 desaturase (Delta-12 desaturase)